MARTAGDRVALSIAASGMAAIVLTGMVSSAEAQDQDKALFAGKRLTMLIANPPGGGTDTIGRLIGNTMVKYLPGRPSIVYQNMPGAAGVKVSNFVYTQRAGDGTVIVTGGGTVFDPVTLQKKEAIQYDPTKFEYIAVITNDSSILAIRKSAIKRLTNPSERVVTMGATSGTRSSELMGVWGGVALGWNLKLVVGYSGTPEVLLALQRGEVDMVGNNSSIRTLLDQNEFTGIAQTGEFYRGVITRNPDFPDVPTIADLVKGKISGCTAKAFEMWQKLSQIGKWYALPPKTPAAYVAAHRAAFDRTIKDPEFQKVAKEREINLQPMTGDEFSSVVTNLVGTTKDTLDCMDALVEKYRG